MRLQPGTTWGLVGEWYSDMTGESYSDESGESYSDVDSNLRLSVLSGLFPDYKRFVGQNSSREDFLCSQQPENSGKISNSVYFTALLWFTGVSAGPALHDERIETRLFTYRIVTVFDHQMGNLSACLVHECRDPSFRQVSWNIHHEPGGRFAMEWYIKIYAEDKTIIAEQLMNTEIRKGNPGDI